MSKKKPAPKPEAPWTFSECVLRVVIGRPENGKLVYRAIDGKIEDLKAETWERVRKELETVVPKGGPEQPIEQK